YALISVTCYAWLTTMNIIAGKIAGTGERTSIELAGGKTLAVQVPTPATEQGKAASFGVRPEDLSIVTGDDYLFEGKVSIVEALGEVTLLYLEAPKGQEPIIVKVPGIASHIMGRQTTAFWCTTGKTPSLPDAASPNYRR
ncbi:MAG: TOBE domain-containing protein, partial [Agrobacterium sp.]|nr:TOBE domain-containing protein [Agrobacterium sp.]